MNFMALAPSGRVISKVSLLLYFRDIILFKELIVFEEIVNGNQYILYAI